MSPKKNPNPNLLRCPELNLALVRLKAATGTPEELRRDFGIVRDAIEDLEKAAMQQSLENLGDYGNVLRGFARGYQNIRTMIDDADMDVGKEEPMEDPPA